MPSLRFRGHGTNPPPSTTMEEDEKSPAMAATAAEQCLSTMRDHIPPFAGRLGGNESFVVDRTDSANAGVLSVAPDAAPGMSLADQFSLRPFRTLGLWKAAFVEGMGTMLFVWVSVYANISPPGLPTLPTAEFGYFANAAYIGPLTGGFANFLLLTLFIFSFGTVTGAHLNPLITIATFCARLCTLPRLVLYVAFQLVGASLGGLLVRASYGTRAFKTGGCWLYTEEMPVGDAFVVEFVTATLFLFFAFGVGLDPRQHNVIPKALSPFLVGMALGVLSWITSYSRYGFGGSSLNPARCFGAYIGSRFPGFHWYHWIGDILACMIHGIFYSFSSPGTQLFKMSKEGHPV